MCVCLCLSVHVVCVCVCVCDCLQLVLKILARLMNFITWRVIQMTRVWL